MFLTLLIHQFYKQNIKNWVENYQYHHMLHVNSILCFHCKTNRRLNCGLYITTNNPWRHLRQKGNHATGLIRLKSTVNVHASKTIDSFLSMFLSADTFMKTCSLNNYVYCEGVYFTSLCHQILSELCSATITVEQWPDLLLRKVFSQIYNCASPH